VLSLAEDHRHQIGLIIFGFGIERLRPARSQGISCVRLNVAYSAAVRRCLRVLYPLSVGLTTLLVNALGGGLIELPASGVGWSAIPCYALTMDAGDIFFTTQPSNPISLAMHHCITVICGERLHDTKAFLGDMPSNPLRSMR